MTEDEWLTRCGFHHLESRPLYERATARQVVRLVVAWLRRYDRYWAPIPSPSEVVAAVYNNDQMDRAIDLLERWAGGRAGQLETAGAAQDAREAARFARVLAEEFVEDDEDRPMEGRARVTEVAADAVESACELVRLCQSPGRGLADGLGVLGDRENPNLPPLVLAREVPHRGLILSTPQQRFLDHLVDDLRGLSGEAIEAEARLTSEQYNAAIDAEFREEQPFLHDVFGNPFRPAAFDPAWRTEAVFALARQVSESRDFATMPVLADALEDAGCADDAILSHCRSGGPHVRGCWVVDLVTGGQA